MGGLLGDGWRLPFPELEDFPSTVKRHLAMARGWGEISRALVVIGQPWFAEPIRSVWKASHDPIPDTSKLD
ncbi:MAG: hypothetical protein VX345_09560, partial [Pseudomonadota bacterium]|nr:hypothetical protein [Pseudomonadota bacterium]